MASPNLTYTCLPAPETLVALGYTTIVAHNETRQHLGAFRYGDDASKFCDALNNPPKEVKASNTATLTASAEVKK